MFNWFSRWDDKIREHNDRQESKKIPERGYDSIDGKPIIPLSERPDSELTTTQLLVRLNGQIEDPIVSLAMTDFIWQTNMWSLEGQLFFREDKGMSFYYFPAHEFVLNMKIVDIDFKLSEKDKYTVCKIAKIVFDNAMSKSQKDIIATIKPRFRVPCKTRKI